MSELGNIATKLIPGRISLIVPCYNVETYLEQFIASVIAQTYKDLEVILVNDGATDGTTQMLRDAVHRLEAECYVVKLIEQENRGLGGAVDTGLKHFTGEFLIWPDPDDWLFPNSIKRRIELMRENPDVGLLRTNAQLFIEATQAFDGYFMSVDTPPHRPVTLFEDLVFQRFFYGPVCHMVRSAMFLEVHPDRSIYFTPASSQNFQLLVPMVEAFPVLQVHEPLAAYRIRQDSRSRAPTKAHDTLMKRHDQLYELTVHTLPKLKTFSEDRASRVMNQHWRNKMLPTAFRARMQVRATDLIGQSALPGWRKALARGLLAIRCNPAVHATDTRTGRIASRVLARCFDALVVMPQREVYWGASPLWSNPAQKTKEGAS